MLATFTFYGIMHLMQGSKEVYPIHFLKTLLVFLGSMGTLFGIQKTFEGVNVLWTEWSLIIFWILAAVSFHLASANRYRRYFGKK